MSDEVLIGKLVDNRYRVVRRLGAGGMGAVYVAIQEPLGREVALKVVRRELAGEKRALERFRREAKSLSTAHHPHIVTLHDFGELPSGALWFAMELVRGEDLRARLVRDGPLPVRKTISIIRDAASGLAAAHAMGIIHRDLKPENILLMEAAGRPDFVKLVDFGVAKLPVEPDADPTEQHLTMRGMVVGTPGYIAPEVALHDVSNDPRSDLYSLGVVWYECLAGRPPFRAQTATALMMMHATSPVPPLPPQVPLPVAGLVQRLLAKAPDDRPANAEALLAALDALPPFDTGSASASTVPRPLGAVGGADPSAATKDDSGNARVVLGVGSPGPASFVMSVSAIDTGGTTARMVPSPHTIERSVAATEAAVPSISPTSSPAIAAQAQTIVTPSLPAPSGPTSLLTAPRLLITVSVGGLLFAVLHQFMGPLHGMHGTSDASTADAGAAVAAVDAGANAVVAVDAGASSVAVVDAGTQNNVNDNVNVNVDVDAGAGANKKRIKKKNGTGTGIGATTIGDDYEPDLD